MANNIWPEYISAREAGALLGLTPYEFRSILDRGKIETDREEEREHLFSKWEKENNSSSKFRYFTSEIIQETRVSVVSLLRYAERKNIYLSLDDNGKITSVKGYGFKNRNEELLNNIFLYKEENAALLTKIDELKLENERLSKVQKDATPKTCNATLAKAKKDYEELKSDYVGAVKLACAIARQGPKGNGNPWTREEVCQLANDLGVALKGDRLKLFKEGMPDDLVKKTAGARPIVPNAKPETSQKPK